MKILLFSDLHAHAFKSYSTTLANGRNSRLQDTLEILSEIRTIADKHQVSGILFGGDLFHIRPGVGTMKIPTFNAVFDAIARLKIGRDFVGLLVGNHDQGDKAGREHSVYAFGSIVTVMDLDNWYDFQTSDETLSVLGIPAKSSNCDIRKVVESFLIPERAENSILLGHLPIAGAVVGCNFVMPTDKATPMDALRPDFFKQIFLGDFHKPQTLQPGVQYLGATHHHNWGDAGQRRGCLIWDSNTDRQHFIPLQSAPRFEKIPLANWEPSIASCAAGPKRGNFVRILHSSPVPGALRDKITSSYLSNGAISVEFWEERSTSTAEVVSATSEFQPAMDPNEMIATFVRKEASEDLDESMLVSMGRDIMNKALEAHE